MSAHPPPVPPANRSDKGPGEPETAPRGETEAHGAKTSENLKEKGRAGNLEQNTRNTGYQQDR